MSQVDPWEKAAECARAIQISHDPHRKAVLNNLQQMWVALATERSFWGLSVGAEVEAIGRLHLTLTEGTAARTLAGDGHLSSNRRGRMALRGWPTSPARRS
jgi:hypothetical protein